MNLFACFKKKSYKRGNILMFVMVFGSVSFVMIVGGLMGYAALEHRGSVRMHQSDMALSIAEKGIEYARWRLAHGSESFLYGPGFHTSLRLELTFDQYPADLSWNIREANSQTIVYSGIGSGNSPHSTIFLEYPLEPGAYIFTIQDAYNDGICCAHGQGSYTLTSGHNEVVFESNGNFGSQEVTHFTIIPWVVPEHIENVYDKSGNVIGEYIVHVIPIQGGAEVDIVSEGRLVGHNRSRHIIRSRFAKESSVQHVLMSTKNIYLHPDMNITGSVLANGGVRADTSTGSWIQSSQANFTFNNGNNTEDGVYGSGGEEAFWRYPVAPFNMSDFADILPTLYETAKNDGSLYRSFDYRTNPSFHSWSPTPIYEAPQPCSSVDFLQEGGNGQCGLGVWFFADGTYRVYKLFRSQNQNPQANQVESQPFPNSLFWSGSTQDQPTQFFPRNYDAPFIGGTYFHSSYMRPIGTAQSVPPNGIIFFENTHVWVGGTTPGRVTVVAARTLNPYHDSSTPRIFPTEYSSINASIFLASHVRQENPENPHNSIGLIAQNFIAPTYSSPHELELHAVGVSQFGSMGVPKQSDFNRASINIFGALIAGGRGLSFKYIDGIGYQNVTLNYDPNLKYNPPPGFPVAPYYQMTHWDMMRSASLENLLSVPQQNGAQCVSGQDCVSGYCNAENICASCSSSSLFANGDFSNGSAGWNVLNHGGFANVSFGDGFADFSIYNGNGEIWQPQLVRNISLVEGQLYTVRFDVKTDESPRTIWVETDGGNDSNWENRGLSENIAVSNSWTTHELTFVANETDSTSRLGFHVGAHTSNIQIDNVSLVQGYACPASTLSVCGGEAQLEYAGQTYGLVEIGDQCWMGENLNVGTALSGPAQFPSNPAVIEKWCTDCNMYGGLYPWAEALQLPSSCYTSNCEAQVNYQHQGICPDGWHIPSDADIKKLEVHLGMCSGSAQWCVDGSGWRGTDQGTQLKLGGTSGFHARLGGYRVYSAFTGGHFTNFGTATALLSSTQSGSGSMMTRILTSAEPRISRGSMDKRNGAAVRCLKNY